MPPIISQLLSRGKNRYYSLKIMKKSALILLILCGLLWTFNPMMGKVLLQTYSGLEVAWLRYFSAFASFLLFAVVSVVFLGKAWGDFFLVPKDFKTARDLTFLGLGPFVLSPIFQFVGLETAQALDNSILLATEPLLTVLMARMILGERMNRYHMISMGLALVGLGIFTGVVNVDPGAYFTLGMVFLLFAQVGEGTFSVFSRKLVQLHPPIAVLGTALLIGGCTLSAIVVFLGKTPDLRLMDLKSWGAVLWLGPMGSTLTYLIWALIARTVSVPAMAITLFIQPIFGAWIGYLILGERLTAIRALGACLILVAIGYLSWMEARHASDFTPE